jgi:hypothetical protein
MPIVQSMSAVVVLANRSCSAWPDTSVTSPLRVLSLRSELRARGRRRAGRVLHLGYSSCLGRHHTPRAPHHRGCRERQSGIGVRRGVAARVTPGLLCCGTGSHVESRRAGQTPPRVLGVARPSRGRSARPRVSMCRLVSISALRGCPRLLERSCGHDGCALREQPERHVPWRSQGDWTEPPGPTDRRRWGQARRRSWPAFSLKVVAVACIDAPASDL